MEKVIACCGAVCSDCDGFPGECAGCPAIAGRVWWAQYLEREDCPIYACCVKERSYPHCGRCAAFPCAVYFDTKDPSLTDEERDREVAGQAAVLRGLE